MGIKSLGSAWHLVFKPPTLNEVPALEQGCGNQTPIDRKLFFRANLLMFLMSKCRGDSDLGQCTFWVQPIPRGVTFSKAFSKLKAQNSNFSFPWNVARESFELWVLNFRKCHLKWDRLYYWHFTKHFIEFVCVETNQLFGSNSNVILTALRGRILFSVRPRGTCKSSRRSARR